MKNIFDMKVTKEEFEKLFSTYIEAFGMEFNEESYLAHAKGPTLVADVIDLHILRGELDSANKVLDKYPRLRQDWYPEGVEWVALCMGVITPEEMNMTDEERRIYRARKSPHGYRIVWE